MDDLDFDDFDEEPHGRARRTDPETSHEAARLVNVTALQILVLTALNDHGPLTAREIATIVKKDLNTITPRLAPLVAAGAVLDTGKRRLSPRNRRQIVWGLAHQIPDYLL
jgi:DNA-binding MarR family transcriptional regulator